MAATLSQPVLGELLTSRQKFVILLSLMLVMFISALDGTIVATAMPRILADLGGFQLLSWVFTVYLLASTVVVPLIGKLSDMFGRKPFILAGIVVFVGASAVCGASTSMIMLIMARAVQGIGGGMLFGSVFATMGDLYTPIERAKYMGVFISAFTVASLTGPTVGGFLTDGVGWRWCFFINVPVGIAASFFIWRNLPFSKQGGSLRDIDFVGGILLSGSTISLLLALVWANERFGWGSPETVGLFAASAIFAAAFVYQESRHPQAILPLHLFRNRVYMQAIVLQISQMTGSFAAIQFLPTFIQTSLGASATASGLVSTPQSLAMLGTTIVGGQIISRTGKFKYQIVLGAVLTLLAAVLLHTLDENVPKWHIAVFMIVAGLGGGMIGPTVSVITQSAVGQESMGVSNSGRQFFMQIGQVVTVAVFGLIFTTTYVSSFTGNIPASERPNIPANVYEEFKDPTLALDKSRYDVVRNELLAEPNGQALLTDSTQAQREAVATAIQRIFLVWIGSACICILAAVTLKEIPLRKTFGPAEADGDGERVSIRPAVEMH